MDTFRVVKRRHTRDTHHKDDMGESTPLITAKQEERPQFTPLTQHDGNGSVVMLGADGQELKKENDDGWKAPPLLGAGKKCFFGVGIVEHRLWDGKGRKIDTNDDSSTTPNLNEESTTKKCPTDSYLMKVAELEKIFLTHFRRCEWDELTEVLERVLILTKMEFGDQHIETSFMEQRLGDAYRLRGNFDSALSMYTDALAVRWVLLGTDHIAVASNIERIADINFINETYAKAKDAYKEAVRVREKNSSHGHVANTMHKLGLVLHRMGENAEATKLLEEALRLKRQKNGALERQENTGTSRFLPDGFLLLDETFDEISLKAMLWNMGEIHLCGGEYTRARECHQEASQVSMNIDMNHFYSIEKDDSFRKPLNRPESPQTASCSSSEDSSVTVETSSSMRVSPKRHVQFADDPVVTTWEIPRIDPDDVKMLFYTENELSQFRKDSDIERSGPDAVQEKALHVSATLDGIGRKNFAFGDYDRAIEAFTHSLRVKTDAIGNDQGSIAGTIHCIGDVYYKQEKLSQALNAYLAALELRRLVYGDTHESLSSALQRIAVIHTKMGNHTQALNAYEEILKIRSTNLGPEHIMVSTIHEAIGIIRFKQGRYRQAMNSVQEALRIKEAQLGRMHEGLVGTLVNAGNVYYTRGNLNRAIKIYARALIIMRRNFDDYKEEIGMTLQNVGNILLERKDYEKAFAAFKESLKIMESLTSKSSNRTLVMESIDEACRKCEQLKAPGEN